MAEVPEIVSLNPNNTTWSGVFGTPDLGGDVELAGDPNFDIDALAKGMKKPVESVAQTKKELEKSLKSGYVRYGEGAPEYAIEAQDKFLKENIGKAVLDYSGEGLYAARIIGEGGKYAAIQGKTNDISMKGTPFYDANATNKQVFFDAQGKRITPEQLAKTERGKAFAAAGWDIGFGPGMIGPGIKAEPVQKDEVFDSAPQSRTVSNTPIQNSSPAPTPPSPPPPLPPPPPVKTAPIDTILFDDTSVPIEIMTDLIFEDIGGQEIINIVRNDTVNGQNIIYQPIKNLSLINQQYNPNNILALQGTSDKYFENFIIKLPNKIPNVGNGPGGKNVYIDTNTADIVVDLINMDQDEQVDIQFRIDGTIYEAEL